MKKLLALAFALVLGSGVAQQALAVPVDCSTGSTYADLQSFGSCTIGDKTFSNFTFLSSPNTILPTQLSYLTINGVNNQWGFNFNPNLDNGMDIQIAYLVSTTSGAPLINSAHNSLLGIATGTGIISVAENYCAGGNADATSVNTCTGTFGTLDIFKNSSSTPQDASASATFSPVSQIGIFKDMNASAGGDGTVSLSGVVNTVDQVVPEPATLGLLGMGLLGLGLVRRRRA